METFVVSGMGFFLSTTNNLKTIYGEESSPDMLKLLTLMVETLIDVILLSLVSFIVLIRLSYAATLIKLSFLLNV